MDAPVLPPGDGSDDVDSDDDGEYLSPLRLTEIKVQRRVTVEFCRERGLISNYGKYRHARSEVESMSNPQRLNLQREINAAIERLSVIVSTPQEQFSEPYIEPSDLLDGCQEYVDIADTDNNRGDT